MANRLIKSYLATQKKAAYVDVYTKMFNPDGSVMQQIFLEDDLHMKATGYAIWKKAIEPYLIK
jgi:lysophospholipase L1-like esterase